MYQIREMREERGASAVLENVIWGRRRSGREPGRCASSRPVSESGGRPGRSMVGMMVAEESEGLPEEAEVEDGEWEGFCSAVGALGWLMAFWPVMTVPSARPAEM